MSGESVPIWQVIEEFKDKIKAQEADLKERNKGLDALEASLKERGQFLDQRDGTLNAKEKEMEQRDQALLPREHSVAKKDKELGVLEEQLRHGLDVASAVELFLRDARREMRAGRQHRVRRHWPDARVALGAWAAA